MRLCSSPNRAAHPPARERGFILINALVIVAAMAAMALLLLSRAETGRSRQAAAQEAVQLRLALDGFEALARQRLGADRDAVDHPGEAWAQPLHNQPLGAAAETGAGTGAEADALRLSGQIHDLQGRFNVNWLSDPQNLRARRGFLLLAQHRGLSLAEAEALAGRITGAVPGAGTPAHRPPAGPLGVVQQLRQVAGVDRADLLRLEPFLAALPGDSGLNLNTTSAPVLQALFPEAQQARITQILQLRRQTPFADIDQFLQQFGAALEPALADLGPDEVPETLLPPRLFATRSDWFEAQALAQMPAEGADRPGAIARRVTILQRLPLPEPVAVAYRLDQPR